MYFVWHSALLFVRGAQQDVKPPIDPSLAPRVDAATKQRMYDVSISINNNLAGDYVQPIVQWTTSIK